MAAFLLVFSFLMNTAFALPPVLYGTVGDASTGGTSTLIIIDQTTGGLQQTIGNIGYIVNGLAIDPTTGILYGSTSFHDPSSPNSLITIDTVTGAGTLVAPFAVPPGTDTIAVITFDSTGQMYGWIEAQPAIEDDLVRIDKNTAGVFQYPDAGLSTQIQSLDFNNADVLYLLNWDPPGPTPAYIYTISTVTGLPILVTSFVPSPNAHHGKFNPITQQFWAINQRSGTNPRNLDIFDLPSGILVNSLPTVNDLHTIAFTVPVDPAIQLYKVLGKKRLIYQKGLFP